MSIGLFVPYAWVSFDACTHLYTCTFVHLPYLAKGVEHVLDDSEVLLATERQGHDPQALRRHHPQQHIVLRTASAFPPPLCAHTPPQLGALRRALV